MRTKVETVGVFWNTLQSASKHPAAYFRTRPQKYLTFCLIMPNIMYALLILECICSLKDIFIETYT